MRTARYGAKIRKLFDAAVKMQKEKYECRKCGKKKVKRVGYAIWRCESCKNVFAGGAYTLTTETGAMARMTIEEGTKL
jgi:large subunit ribosomal protein L37Ae